MYRPNSCGTIAGYRRHKTLGQPPCLRCIGARDRSHEEDQSRLKAEAAKSRAFVRHRLADHPVQYLAARAGNEPAEALTTADRHRLVAEFVDTGWPLNMIAAHTRMTDYTTARIWDEIQAGRRLRAEAAELARTA